MALAALEAGVQCLRLNPGNIRKPEHIKAVAQRGQGPRRADPHRRERRLARPRRCTRSTAAGHARGAGRVGRSASSAYFDEVGFDDVKISVKASNVPLMIEAYRLLSETTDHPLHLGVTEAGPPPAGLLKATAGIATLLAEGIGDTIRYSLTADPVEEARAGPPAARGAGPARAQGPRPHRLPVVRAGRGRRHRGRADGARPRSASRKIPLQVAVMGCVVNGPGEARDADLGIAAGRQARPPVREGPTSCASCPRPRWSTRSSSRPSIIAEQASRRALADADDGAAAEAEADRAGAARRAGRRRQRQRADGRAHPQARSSNAIRRWPRHRRLTSARHGQGSRAHPPGRGLPPLVPGRRRQGRAGRQRAGAGHDGHPPLRLRDLGADAGRGRRPHQGGRRRERLLPAVHPRELPRSARPSTSRASAPSSRSSPTPAARSSRSRSSCGPPARRSSASSWRSGSRATATCRCC